MSRIKKMTIEEFKNRYKASPELFIELQKYGTIIFHPNYETLQEILFYNFVYNAMDNTISFEELIGVETKNPFFTIYEQQGKDFNNLIGYNPDKKNTAVLEVDNKEKY